MRRVLLLLAALVLATACSSDKGFGETREVEADDYGAEWPLTVETALLTCTPEGGLLVQVDGRAYGLGDVTEMEARPHFRRVWAPRPDESGERMDLSPLVEDARALCE